MAKRKRLEDLGIIREKLNRLDDYFSEFFDRYNSKHAEETFLKDFESEDKRYDLHSNLRSLKYQLDDIIAIAWGDDE